MLEASPGNEGKGEALREAIQKPATHSQVRKKLRGRWSGVKQSLRRWRSANTAALKETYWQYLRENVDGYRRHVAALKQFPDVPHMGSFIQPKVQAHHAEARLAKFLKDNGLDLRTTPVLTDCRHLCTLEGLNHHPTHMDDEKKTEGQEEEKEEEKTEEKEEGEKAAA